MPVSYFLGPRLLATTSAQPFWDDTSLVQSSQVFVCPTCGEAWGRIMIDGRQWLPVRRGCAKHPYIEEIGGTFLAPWRQRFDEYPKAVLEYELAIRLKALPE